MENYQMKIKPLYDRVLVQPITDEEKTTGGIIVPDSAKEKPMKGKVVAIGPGSINKDGKRIPLDIKVDDVVLYGKYSGTEIKLNETEYLIMKEDDIFAVLN
jgi:chaperonin GroES